MAHMDDRLDNRPDAEAVRLMARLGGLDLDLARAAALVAEAEALYAVDRKLAALDLDAYPASGDPWGPLGPLPGGTAVDD